VIAEAKQIISFMAQPGSYVQYPLQTGASLQRAWRFPRQYSYCSSLLPSIMAELYPLPGPRLID